MSSPFNIATLNVSCIFRSAKTAIRSGSRPVKQNSKLTVVFRQAPLQHQVVEDFHWLLQLPAGGRHCWREDLLLPRGPQPGPAEHGADPTHYAANRRARPGTALWPTVVWSRQGEPTDVSDQGLLCDLDQLLKIWWYYNEYLHLNDVTFLKYFVVLYSM